NVDGSPGATDATRSINGKSRQSATFSGLAVPAGTSTGPALHTPTTAMRDPFGPASTSAAAFVNAAEMASAPCPAGVGVSLLSTTWPSGVTAPTAILVPPKSMANASGDSAESVMTPRLPCCRSPPRRAAATNCPSVTGSTGRRTRLPRHPSRSPARAGMTEPRATRSWRCVSVAAMSGASRGASSAVEVGEPRTDEAPAQAMRRRGERRLPSLSPARWRLIAKVLGAISVLCALAIPFMPVVQDTARIEWPGPNDTRSVNAPLVGYWAQEFDATLPCRTIQSLDDALASRAMLLSTVPRARINSGVGMHMQVDNNVLTVVNRGQQIVSQPLPDSGCDVRFSSTGERTSITVAGASVYDENTDVRPRVVGIYSDITADREPIDGLRVSITPDTRYQSSPTVWKTLTTVVGVLALLGCLFAVNRLDSRVARRAPRWAPIGWWKLTARDLTVIGALGLWVFIGPVTSDDGYI